MARIKRFKIWSAQAPWALGMIGLVLALDQLSKYAVLNRLKLREGQSYPVTSFFDLTLVWNRGVSYGLFASGQQAWLIILSLVVVIGLWIWLCQTISRFTVLGISLIIGGALGNAFDRYYYSAVIDFLHFFWKNWHWYVFNIADVAIVVGVVILMLDSAFEKPNLSV